MAADTETKINNLLVILTLDRKNNFSQIGRYCINLKNRRNSTLYDKKYCVVYKKKLYSPVILLMVFD